MTKRKRVNEDCPVWRRHELHQLEDAIKDPKFLKSIRETVACTRGDADADAVATEVRAQQSQFLRDMEDLRAGRRTVDELWNIYGK